MNGWFDQIEHVGGASPSLNTSIKSILEELYENVSLWVLRATLQGNTANYCHVA